MLLILSHIITPPLLSVVIYYCASEIMTLLDSRPTDARAAQFMRKRLAFGVSHFCICAVMLGLFMVTAFLIGALNTEQAMGYLALALAAIWFLFYGFIRLLRYLLAKDTPLLACVVAAVPAIVLWVFLLMGSSALASL